MEDGIKLFTKIKPGQCPYCLGTIVDIQSETNILVLSENGFPVKEHTEIRDNGFCLNCEKSFDLARHGKIMRVVLEPDTHKLVYGKETGYNDDNTHKTMVVDFCNNPFSSKYRVLE